MEWLEDLGVFIATYGDKILSWLGVIGGTTIGGISLWKIGTIIVNLIKKAIEKKYTSKQKEYSETVIARIEELENKIQNFKTDIKDAFNELEEKKAEKKQELYEQVFNEKQEIEEIEQKVEAEIDIVKPIVEEIKQEVIDVVKVENEPQKETETNKDNDLL